MDYFKRLLLRVYRFLGDYRAKYVLAAAVIVVLGVTYCISQLIKTEHGGSAAVYEIYGEVSEETKDSDNETMFSEEVSEEQNREDVIYVYICGCVNKPGVYTCGSESRVFELIELAGGVTEEADVSALNFVELAEDGQKLYVPSVNENVSAYEGAGLSEAAAKVNINKADAEELMTLPGIGESRANDIIKYRKSEGGFDCIEDIMKVSGIKEAAFEKIKDLIKV